MRRKVWKKKLRDRRSIKYNKHRVHRKYCYNKGYDSKINTLSINESIYKSAVTKTYSAPDNFSFIDNANETIEYFKDIYGGIFKKLPGTNFIIDSSQVTKVTVDVLIYLIAIMENMKLIRTMKYNFTGNFPVNKEAKMTYVESGFIDYVESKTKKLPNKSKMTIVSGTLNLPTISKEVCDFIISELSIKKQQILFVQKILVELMSNAYYHAYPDDKTNRMYPKWYIYSELVDDKIRVIFADTGKGIAGTVRRRWRESVFSINDEELIYFAFQPDSFIRTETKLPHRGNGLPGIKDIILDSPISSFWVLSGGGGLHIGGNNGQKKLTKLHYEHKIYGTIIVFEFKRSDI